MSLRPIKVLMFGWEFPPHNSGGLGTACLGLVRGLSRLGEEERPVEVTFVLPRKQAIYEGSAKFVFATEGRNTIFIKEINSILTPYLNAYSYEDYYRLLTTGEKSFYGGNLFSEVERYSKLAGEVARTEEFDIIHVHDWLSFGAGLHAKKISNKPLVAHVHATEFDRTGGAFLEGHVFNIERYGMEHADRVVAVSQLTKRIIVEKYGISEEKVSVVHNGIDTQALCIGDDCGPLEALRSAKKDLVLFVGRLTLQKGVEYFLYAAKTVLAYRPETLFVVAGSGDMAERIISLSAELGISKNVIFTGFLRGAELDQVYRAADLFVMPSVSEPFGLTALEAIENGTPVLLSKQSGVSEVVSHSLRVDFWDTEAMADKILSVLTYPSLKKLMKENAFKELASISWDKAAQKCADIYGQLIGQNTKV